MSTYIPTPPSDPQLHPAEPEPPKKRRTTCWGCTSAVVLSLGVLCAAFFAFGFLTQAGQSMFASTGSFFEGGIAVGDALAVTEKFYDSLIKHHYESAHNDLAPSMAAKYSTKSLEEKWSAFEKWAGAVKIDHISGYIETGDNNSFRAVVIFARPEKGGQWELYETEHLKLSKVSGAWKITDAQPSLILEP